MNFTNRII